MQQNRIREQGAESLNLHVKRNQSQIVRAEVGINFSRCYSLCGGNLQPRLTVGWVGHRLVAGKNISQPLRIGIEIFRSLGLIIVLTNLSWALA